MSAFFFFFLYIYIIMEMLTFANRYELTYDSYSSSCFIKFILSNLQMYKLSLLPLTLSHRLDVPNVNFLPSTGADMTLRTSSPQRQVGKDRCEGVLYYYAGRHERVKSIIDSWFWVTL